ncbi:hypothetical protein [Mucilaginibacter aquaedulcis]|uniref:hypothetical protein n=1 Tax=Mucilaginibacter aquaedulcis TaxID=1187081 RepID=UPI0025B2DBA7|nr:hypothetical protein [Mucilaginibacter aquaedulcis]MDN3547246.1 hypothetical protein [Mucilaginibacter aquaedulcis]
MNFITINLLAPQVWGTVSDWFVVTGTFLTAILLFLTFRSQIAVQKNQQRIADMEAERFKFEHKPTLNLTNYSIVNKEIDSMMHSTVSFKLNLSKRDCKNLNVKPFNTASTIADISISKNHNGLILPIPHAYEPITYELHFKILSNPVLFSQEGATIIFYLEYEDVIGNCYSQEYIYTFTDKIEVEFIKNPQLISQVK